MINEVIYVGVIQTSLDYEAAWVDEKNGIWQDCVRISTLEELRAKKEIRHYLASLQGLGRRCDIVLLPELAVPIGFERHLKRAAETLEAIIIAGLDYQIEAAEPVPTVSNEAVIIVPRKLNGRRIARRTEIRRVGKTYPSPAEEKRLQSISSGSVTFMPSPTIWIFESPALGNFAVAVCRDFHFAGP